jgi:superfamily II DNA/RNA helicase
VATDLAARGIHVEQIAHVINYDLPEVAENFIHRVGRTGRAGSHGVASTLFANEQRSELFQLERTLGIRMERIPVDGPVFENRERTQAPAPRKQTGYRRMMVALPGEILQAQMQS